MHLRRGGEICEGNVFIQGLSLIKLLPLPRLNFHLADPSSPTTITGRAALTSTATDAPTPDLPYDVSPLKSSQSVPGSLSTNPFLTDSFGPRVESDDNILRSRPPPAHPSSASSLSGKLSPRRASLSSGPPPPPPASSKPRVQGISMIGVRPGSTNPFLQRSRTHSGAIQSKTASSEVKLPPLPPRKPAHMSSTASSHTIASDRPIINSTNTNTSIDTVSSSVSNSSTSTSTLPPPHRVTPLMQQSLLASRAGANLKRAQDEAGRTRVLEVIRSSSDAPRSRERERDKESVRSVNSSQSPEKGTRRPVPRPPSPNQRHRSKSMQSAPSEDSFVQVASARLNSISRERGTESPNRLSETESQATAYGLASRKPRPLSMSSHPDNTGAPPGPPPTHPARRPSTHSSSGIGRHVRSPSYQSFSQSAKSPFSASASVPPSSAPSSDSPSSSSSSSPSPSPASPHFSRSGRSMSMHQPFPSPGISGRASPPKPPPRRPRPISISTTADQDVSYRTKGKEQGLDDFGFSNASNNPFKSSQRERAASGRSDKIGSLASRFEVSKLAQPVPDRGRKDFEDHHHHQPQQQNSFASLQRKFSALQQRAQPTLVQARYKAEAGIHPRRGYVRPHSGRRGNEDGERLVDDYGEELYDSGEEMNSDFGQLDINNDEDDDQDQTIRGRDRGRERVRKPGAGGYTPDMDDLKLPQGEGWAPL